MIWFLLKGLIRDKSRSLFPIIIVTIGTALTTVIFSFMNGIFSDLVDASARFSTGHVKVVTRAYEELIDQVPNDLAMFGTDELISKFEKEYPEIEWAQRIKFGGLLDIPDENGETRSQQPVAGIAIDMLSPASKEAARMQIDQSIIRGSMPANPGEIIISDSLAIRLDVKPGDVATLLGASANGGMAIQNFLITGTVKFGMIALDRGAIIADLADIQYALDMNNGCGELLGFFDGGLYSSGKAHKIRNSFNSKYSDVADEYSPVMLTLEDQNGLGQYLDFAKAWGFILVGIFVFAMSIVLWNTGLMSGIRRYGEVGVRLAMGEAKQRIYRSLLWESVLTGIAGSVIGTMIGLAISLYLQENGFNIADNLKGSTLLVNNIIKAQITFASYYIGFIPGLLATLLGTAIAGIAIFKRQTAVLFKELER